MITHQFQSAIPDGADDTLIQPSDWNNEHKVEGGIDLPLETVTAPATDKVRIFGRKVSGRMIPAFKGPSGLDSLLQPNFARNKISMWTATPSGTAGQTFGYTVLSGGTGTAANVSSTSLFTSMRRMDYLVTTAATSAIAFFGQGPVANNFYFRGVGNYGGFHLIMRFGGATGMVTATHRFFAGMTSGTANPTDAEPNSRSNIIGVGYGAADANWKLMHKLGTAAATEVDLGALFPRQSVDRSKMYELALFSPPGGSSVFYEFTDLATGDVVSGEITTNLPDSTTTLKPLIAASVGGTSSVIGITVVSVYVETDY